MSDLGTVDSIRILGVRVDVMTWDGLMAWLDEAVREGRPRQVATVNPEFIMRARQEPAFAKVLEEADLALADGAGLLWAARLQGQPLPDRITGSDGVPRIAAHCADRGLEVFLLGAAEGVAELAASILTRDNPGLRIAGTYAGSPSPEEEDHIVAMIRQAAPDVLFVAYGAPNQDYWIARTKERHGVPFSMGVGGSFDFIAGVTPRAPVWMQEHGLEWLYRLYKQPWRWRRMLALPRFTIAVLIDRLRGAEERT